MDTNKKQQQYKYVYDELVKAWKEHQKHADAVDESIEEVTDLAYGLSSASFDESEIKELDKVLETYKNYQKAIAPYLKAHDILGQLMELANQLSTSTKNQIEKGE